MKSLTLLLIILMTISGCRAPAGGPPEGDWPMRSIVYQVSGEEVVDDVHLVGTLYANESVELQSEISGRMEKIHFEEGQEVKAGTLLFEIDATKLQADVDQSRANYNLAKANLSRSDDLFKKRTISSQEFDQAQAEYKVRDAERQRLEQLLREARVTAPFDGFVGARRISPGQYVGVGDRITSLVSLNPIKLEFEVPERFLSRLSIGQTVTVNLAAYPQESFTAEVYFISPEINSDTRTALVKALIDNPEAKLRPGMFASLRLILEVRSDATVIPESALMLEGDTQTIYVVEPNKRVAARQVKMGKVLPGRVEIIEGLSAGEVVVTEGMQKLRPGSLVDPAPDSTIYDHSYFSEGA